MEIYQDDKIPEDQRDDAVQKAILFAVRHGANENDLERIVQHTGLHRADLHRTIVDTRTVMDSLLSWTYERLMSVFDRAAGRGQDPLDALEKIFESHVWLVVRTPGITKLLHHILGNPHSRMRKHAQQIMRGYEHKISVIVQEAKNNGLVHNNINAKAAATLFVGMVQSHMLRMQILGDAQMVRNEARTMLELYLRGIRTAA